MAHADCLLALTGKRKRVADRVYVVVRCTVLGCTVSQTPERARRFAGQVTQRCLSHSSQSAQLQRRKRANRDTVARLECSLETKQLFVARTRPVAQIALDQADFRTGQVQAE